MMNASYTVPPYGVVADLERHVLVDGFRIVLDMEKSQGSRLVDGSTHRGLIDFYSFYGSMPVGFNHPYFDLPEVRDELLQASRTKVANADVYTTYYATFVDTFSRLAGLPPLERYFFIDGGAL